MTRPQSTREEEEEDTIVVEADIGGRGDPPPPYSVFDPTRARAWQRRTAVSIVILLQCLLVVISLCMGLRMVTYTSRPLGPTNTSRSVRTWSGSSKAETFDTSHRLPPMTKNASGRPSTPVVLYSSLAPPITARPTHSAAHRPCSFWKFDTLRTWYCPHNGSVRIMFVNAESIWLDSQASMDLWRVHKRCLQPGTFDQCDVQACRSAHDYCTIRPGDTIIFFLGHKIRLYTRYDWGTRRYMDCRFQSSANTAFPCKDLMEFAALFSTTVA
jgi:hypothetical protein